MNTILPQCLSGTARSALSEDPADRLTEREKNLVPTMVQKFFPDAMPTEREDLESVGREALVKSARTYQGDRGTFLSTYCYGTIRWALLERLFQERRR